MDTKVQSKLQALFEAYLKNLPEKIKVLETEWQEQCDNGDTFLFVKFHRDVHSLCGSAATYGYPEISKVAKELEVYLKPFLGKEALTTEQKEVISDLLNKLKITVTHASIKKIPTLQSISKETSDTKLIYILEANNNLIEDLDTSMKYANYSLLKVPDIHSLELEIQKKSPEAMIINTNYLDDSAIDTILNLQLKQNSTIPLFCIVPNSDIIPRLRAIRSGSNAFFQVPVDVFSFSKVIDHMCGTTTDNPYRILVVDDSESLAEYYSLILSQAGMMVHTISDPLQLIRALGEFQPDVLLMDVYMPTCSGLELASILRQEALYTKIPIIFLSSEDDRVKQLTALSLGADDFLTKPITPQHLVSAVKSRAKRAGILNYYMTSDSLTGLLNHTSILNRLEIELAHAKHYNLPLSFIMIDIDHFKNVNDMNGHLFGDTVLQKLSNLLLTRLRRSDYVGRYGGEEFAIILPNTQLVDAKIICNDLIKQFAGVQFMKDGAHFNVTLSAGIANYPLVQDLHQLIEQADQALYRAKQKGRNQTVVFNE